MTFAKKQKYIKILEISRGAGSLSLLINPRMPPSEFVIKDYTQVFNLANSFYRVSSYLDVALLTNVFVSDKHSFCFGIVEVQVYFVT